MTTLDAARLRELLHYDPATGIFTWRSTGESAGSLNDRGYVRIRVDGFDHRAHRLAVLYVDGSWPDGEVDHKNRIRHDNRWDNLRQATRSQNRGNLLASNPSASGFKGVYWAPHVGRWRAELTLQRAGRRVKRVLGYFDDPELAAEFRDLAGWLIWGDFYKPALAERT